MMEAVLFGRSPFVGTVDVNKIIENHFSVGLNHFALSYKPDMVFYLDKHLGGNGHSSIIYPFWMGDKEGTPIAPKTAKGPQLVKEFQRGRQKLTYVGFVSSIALNWLLLHGYQRVYLVGIDHIETEASLSHFDGIDRQSNIRPETHQKFKKFVYQCSKNMTIYQCNPEVQSQWELPSYDVKLLYDRKTRKSKTA